MRYVVALVSGGLSMLAEERVADVLRQQRRLRLSVVEGRAERIMLHARIVARRSGSIGCIGGGVYGRRQRGRQEGRKVAFSSGSVGRDD